MTSDPQLNRNEFEYWLILMDRHIEEFIANLPEDYVTLMDYSTQSLEVVGTWVLQNYQTKDSVKHDSREMVVNGLVSYVGETFRKNLGGKWNVHINESGFRFGELPVIEGFDQLGSVVCPIVSILKTVEKHASWYMRVELEAWMNEIKAN